MEGGYIRALMRAGRRVCEAAAEWKAGLDRDGQAGAGAQVYVKAINAQHTKGKGNDWSVPVSLCPNVVFLKPSVSYLRYFKQDYSM